MLHSSRILRYPKSVIKHTKSSPVWPTVSLGSIIANGEDRFKPLDKVILAVNLSRAFLRIYSSEMQSKEWNAENIFFLFNTAERTIYEAYNPYFTYSLLQIQRYADDEPGRPRKFAVLVSFAKLLLEIALGKPLGPFSVHRDIALLEIIDESEAADSVVKGYLDAIAACLEANKRRKDDDSDSESDSDDEHESNSDNDSMDEETQCRRVISTVVTYLEDARENNFRSRKDFNFAKKLKVSDDVQSQTISKAGNIAAPVNCNGPDTKLISTNGATQAGMAVTTISQDKYNPGSPGQLFDVRKMVFNPGDERIFRANDFLSRANNFYTEHIQNLSDDRKIRIAILDTGINEDHAFFKGVKRRRRAKDSPFKGMQSFIGDSNTADSFGHGTNVASLILKIAPEANLYIAKISKGQEEEGSEPIVKAIQWATSRDVNADIISMSFAFLNDQPIIKEAIKNAEKEGVIFFAAASNYGGNTPRLFPAKLHDRVLCIHASDGAGNKSGMDPTPKPFSENLSTLGVAIPSISEPGVFVSGTSYSTPVMVGMAANILRFVQHVTNEGLLTEEQRIEAFTRMGVRNILLAMSDVRDKYNYVTPWRKMWNVGAGVGDVVSKIKEALKE
ncbi:subtilisin-like protein [Hyaloscypha variabilis F]|uniref:Subtilisin-like protein n=1 Tax=Hyaloscypha variabilis (strain UAMH 11265 / GT02V1 / F) TaxID=1149755 RepID=A0A2J6S880_HYAVF|nr:subtilisin-like protein [Hyaloscypha variabilis F]